MKKTKIICTMGPSTDADGMIEKLISNGMDCARLNFSHGTHDEHKLRIDAVRKVAEKKGRPIALLLDTKGPEMRLGEFAAGKVTLKKGSNFTLTQSDEPGDESHAPISYKGLFKEVSPGDTLLLSDGLVALRVEKIDGKDIISEVLNDGPMSTRKRVAAPGIALGLAPVSEQDEKDIAFGAKIGMDIIAASFVQRASDVEAIRELAGRHGGRMEIFSKIENLEGVKNFDSILAASDGIMVARGDLGVEIPAEDVPLIQKEIIKECNIAGKPVIVATQMLESMTANPRPTRAEASDVANAILDGADAIMLSGETAGGNYPAEAVETMNRIACRTETALSYDGSHDMAASSRHGVTESVAHAAVHLADELGAKLVITPTVSGYTARMVSKYRPKADILALTPDESVARQLSIRWGIISVVAPHNWESVSDMTEMASKAAVSRGIAKPGDAVVIASGISVSSKNTNSIRVHTIQ